MFRFRSAVLHSIRLLIVLINNALLSVNTPAQPPPPHPRSLHPTHRERVADRDFTQQLRIIYYNYMHQLCVV